MKLEVFIAYSHADERMKQKLIKHLSPLKRTGLVEEWNDRQIQPGADWGREIDQHLNRSQIIVLLISDDFIHSDYCYSIEMKRALERHALDEARVIPVILRPCDWPALPFGRLQGLPLNGKPVTKWSNQDEAYTDIARGLRKVVEEMRSKASHQAEAEAGTTYNVTYRVIARPVFVASEGYTERTADLILNLSTESVLASTALPLTVRVYVNTAVTNSLSADGLSDAVLISDTGTILANGRVAGNELTFKEVTVPCPRPGQETTLHIRNLVVNASGLREPCMINATVVIEGPPSVRIVPTPAPHPGIAIPTQALAFWVTVPKDGTFPVEASESESAPENAIAHIHFAERFPGGFRYRSKGPVGTQLMAMFTGLPRGASLWVGTRPIRGSDCANLVAREAATLSPIQATDTFNGVPVVKLPVVERLSDGNESVSIAVWEVEAPQSRDVRSYEFPIFLRYEPPASPNLTQITAYGSLAPNPLGGGFTSTTGSAASSRLRIPRYSTHSTKKCPLFPISSEGGHW
jgi:hypothetical protein